jgi:hypothetical protein
MPRFVSGRVGLRRPTLQDRDYACRRSSAHDRSEIPPASPAGPAGGGAPRRARADRAARPWSRCGLRCCDTAVGTAGQRGGARRSGAAPSRERACAYDETSDVFCDACSSSFRAPDCGGAHLDGCGGARSYPVCCGSGRCDHTCCCHACRCCACDRSCCSAYSCTCGSGACKRIGGCHHARSGCDGCQRGTSDARDAFGDTHHFLATCATGPGADGSGLHCPQPGR